MNIFIFFYIGGHLFLLTEENKTLHLYDTHVSVSLSVYVTLQIFSYLSIYLYINS
jgi:tRNA pseudouridine-54 N-methylase